MTGEHGGASGREIRELGRSLAGASDARVARAVAAVDQLPSRGVADGLIEPLRPRLAQLRPLRPMRFIRLLFLPLDPLIVPPPRWQPKLPTIPRSALTPLAATVRAGMGAGFAEIDAIILSLSSQQTEVVDRVGELLWSRAAEVLAVAPPPVGWEETGLSLTVYPRLAARVGAVLAQATVLRALTAEADMGIAPPRPPALQAMFGDVNERCPDAVPMLVTLLMARLPQFTERLADLDSGQDPGVEEALRQAGQQAAEALLLSLESHHGVEAAATCTDLANAAQEVRRSVALLRQLTERAEQPQTRARIQAVRQRLDAGCRQRFGHAVTAEFLPLLRQSATAAGPAGISALEATARHLRALESEARAIGGGEIYDAQLQGAASEVRALGAEVSLPERVRLVEILAGAEAAFDYLSRSATTSPAFAGEVEDAQRRG
jgi:hypothetical protein